MYMVIYIEINIGKSGKKTILNKADNRFVNIKSWIQNMSGIEADTFQLIDKQILKIGYFWRLSAYAEFSAAFSAGCLFTLIAEHIVSKIHIITHIILLFDS